jgi:prepilin-type N-terminal cleavage/methylation domain-containing protein
MMNKLRRFFKKNTLSNQGFTLIEIIMAIVVISLAIVPIILVLPGVLKDTAIVEYMDIGSRLAEQQIERVLSLPFSSVVATATTAYTGDFSDYNYSIAISADGTICLSTVTCKAVDITINHDTVGNLMTIRTYVTDV